MADADSAGFWAAARAGRFELCRCTDCAAWLQPPLERCRYCGGPTRFDTAAGTGRIYSFIVVRHPSVPAFRNELPYAIALVDLAEGVRLPGRIVDAELADIVVDAPVEVDFRAMVGTSEPAVVFRLRAT